MFCDCYACVSAVYCEQVLFASCLQDMRSIEFVRHEPWLRWLLFTFSSVLIFVPGCQAQESVRSAVAAIAAMVSLQGPEAMALIDKTLPTLMGLAGDGKIPLPAVWLPFNVQVHCMGEDAISQRCLPVVKNVEVVQYCSCCM